MSPKNMHQSNSTSLKGCSAPSDRLRAAHRTAKHLLGQLERETLAGNVEAVRRKQKLFLRSFDVRLWALGMATRKRRVNLSYDALVGEAGRLNAWQGTDEVVRYRWQPKEGGGFRPVCRFGYRNIALQIMAREALRACTIFPEWQYDIKGRGTNQAVAGMERALREGFGWVFLGDISRCFESIDEQRLSSQLRLPDAVVQQVLLAGNLVMEPERRSISSSSDTPFPMCLRAHAPQCRPVGLPQGSAASNLVASALFADLADALPVGVRTFAYRDDFAVFARTRREACTVEVALGRALSEHAAGRLGLGRSEVRKCSEGFDLLGYHIRLSGGQAVVRPTDSNLEEGGRRFYEGLVADLEAGRREPVQVMRALQPWQAGFPRWDTRDLWVRHHLMQAERVLRAT